MSFHKYWQKESTSKSIVSVSFQFRENMIFCYKETRKKIKRLDKYFSSISNSFQTTKFKQKRNVEKNNFYAKCI